MLKVNQLNGFNISDGAAPIESTYVGVTVTASNSDTYTFNGVDIGTAFTGRHILAVTIQSAGGPTTSTLTIDGTSMPKLIEQINDQSVMCIFMIPINTGTTADFVLSGGTGYDRAGIAIYSLKNVKFNSAFATASDIVPSPTTTLSADISAIRSSVIIGATFAEVSDTVTWSSTTNTGGSFTSDFTTYFGGESRRFAGFTKTATVPNIETITATYTSDLTAGTPSPRPVLVMATIR